MKSLINKYQEELKKLNLECKVLKECNDKWNVQILEDGVVVLNKWNVSKQLQWNSVKNFAIMTRQSVDLHKRLEEVRKGLE